MNIIRFQSSAFTSKLKGYVFQTAKLWKEQVELTDMKKATTKPKFSLKMVSYVKMSIFDSL